MSERLARACFCSCHRLTPPRPQASPWDGRLPSLRRALARLANARECLPVWLPRVVDAGQPAESVEEYDREELDDLKHAIALLDGDHEKPNGPESLPNKRYLEGAREFVARKSLVRLLRNPKPLDSKLRLLLAALFDPDPEQAPYVSFESAPVERRIDLKFRRPGGGRLQSMRKLELGIAFENLCREPGKSRDDALWEIAEKYSVDTRTVETAAKHLRTVCRRLLKS